MKKYFTSSIKQFSPSYPKERRKNLSHSTLIQIEEEKKQCFTTVEVCKKNPTGDLYIYNVYNIDPPLKSNGPPLLFKPLYNLLKHTVSTVVSKAILAVHLFLPVYYNYWTVNLHHIVNILN